MVKFNKNTGNQRGYIMEDNKNKSAMDKFYENKPLRYLISTIAFIILSICYFTFDFSKQYLFIGSAIIILLSPSIFPIRRDK